jgi:phosphopantothenoylcysteine decarboxylase/phosphopantothenate--cysteine ligase
MKEHILKDKKILVGVTGSIAAYKSCELVSYLVKAGATVKVAMTHNATRFVSPLTFESLSGHRVYSDMFGRTDDNPYAHLELADFPDAVVIAPATANMIGKVANGIADDLLSTLTLALQCPLIIAPAMNSRLFLNRVVQENISRLAERGVRLVPPTEGHLACGEVGPGKLAEISDIVREIAVCVNISKTLSGKKILITSGRTEEPLDPVRFITNRSSGKMGFAVARAARRRDASVTVISGPNQLIRPYDVDVVAVRTAGEMHKEVLDRIEDADILVMVAAVGDYYPVHYSESKMMRGKDPITLKLVPTEDILKAAREKAASDTLLVGFALEYENEVERAWTKLEEKGLDMIVVNNPGVDGAGFEVDTNKATILTRKREEIPFPLLTKDELADKIFDVIETL